jgi:uncharacterized NAD(P)/FAD-binding protein YdhS
MIYTAAFPLENAEKMLALLARKEIDIKNGLQDISYDAEKRVFDIALKNETLHADYVINATGAGHDVLKTSSPLLQNMLKRGLLIPYSLGGVKVDFKSLRALSKENTTGLYVMGDGCTFGACLVTADLNQSSKQATRVANAISAHR